MALVRVYCGLASANPTSSPPGSELWLTVAVVDDAGHLLDVYDISNDAVGYAKLSALLAEHSAGSVTVTVAADSDGTVVTQLLAAAGKALAYPDHRSTHDYAERFTDDGSAEEIRFKPLERRAVGLARALQAGVLSAVPQTTHRDLADLKPILAAHAAVVAGRRGPAVTLREVLHELYPAALRAFPDPTQTTPLSVLDALPEPGLLSGAQVGDLDSQVIAELTAAGPADVATITGAVTALRVAIAETPRRTGLDRTVSTAIAATVRHAVAAVRACDSATTALISLLTERVTAVGTGGSGGHRTLPAPSIAMASAGAISPVTGYTQPSRGTDPGDLDRYTSPAPSYSNSRTFAGMPSVDAPAYSSRANWPLVGDPPTRGDELQAQPANARSYPRGGALAVSGVFRQADIPRQREDQVTPLWQTDDPLAVSPASLLVKPDPLADPVPSEEWRYGEFDGELRYEPASPSPVDAGHADDAGHFGHDALDGVGSRPPVATEGDGDLLIFAATRSAWFISHIDVDPNSEVDWTNSADLGWHAAKQAAQHSTAAETMAGLPIRVPQQNLVPGSPDTPADRPLRIVRDPAAIAAHTSGYFQGWRRGQEVGGYKVGGRPGRESAGGWDFSREPEEDPGPGRRAASQH